MEHDKPETETLAAETSPAKPAPTLDIDAFRAILGPGQRLIGIDVGTKTLGLALSDVNRTIASGLETIRRKKFTPDATYLLELAAKHGVGGLVLGLPLNLDGTEGPRAQGTRAFQRNLARMTRLPMLFWDERLSTAAAERTLIESDASRKRRSEVIDKMAATIILQTAIDRMKNA
jgi:putative holliday junction resolvase